MCALVLVLHCCLQANGGYLCPGQCAGRTDHNYSGGSTVQELAPQGETHFSGALCLRSPPLEGVARGGGCVVHWCDLKLNTVCVGSGTSWESQAKGTWHERQSDLQMAATCAELGGAWERPSWIQRLAVTSARPGAA